MTMFRVFGVLLALLPLAAAFILLAAVRPYVVDDTFITMHYARNLVDHGVLTWWPGGEMVDGFTSLLHTLLIAAGYGSGLTPLASVALVNYASLLAIVVTLAICLRHHAPSTVTVALSLVLINAGFVFWINGGLDGILFSLALLWSYLAMREAVGGSRLGARAFLALSMLHLVRPEGLLIAPAVVVAFLLRQTLLRQPNLKSSVLWALAILLGIVAVIVWRLDTYGHVFPNTYYAKASASIWLEVGTGIAYLSDWIVAKGGFILILSPIALVVSPGSWLRALFVWGYVALVVVAGGDPHPAGRFLLPLLPLLALDLAEILAARRQVRRVGLVIAILSAALQVSLTISPLGPADALRRATANLSGGRIPLVNLDGIPLYENRIAAIEVVSAGLPEEFDLAATDVGAVAFFSGRRIIDTAGLNDRELARVPRDPDTANEWGAPALPVVLDRGVDAVQMSFPSRTTWRWMDIVDGSVRCDGEAKRLSTLTAAVADKVNAGYLCASRAAGQGTWVNILVHRDRISDLMAHDPGWSTSACTVEFIKSCR